MAEHPHLVLARELWAAVADGDAARIRVLLADDVVWTSTGLSKLSGRYEGPEDVLDFLIGVGEGADDLTSTMKGIYVGEDGAVIFYHVSARKGSKTLEMDGFLRLTVLDGRINEALIVPVDQRANDDFWG